MGTDGGSEEVQKERTSVINFNTVGVGGFLRDRGGEEIKRGNVNSHRM